MIIKYSSSINITMTTTVTLTHTDKYGARGSSSILKMEIGGNEKGTGPGHGIEINTEL